MHISSKCGLEDEIKHKKKGTFPSRILDTFPAGNLVGMGNGLGRRRWGAASRSRPTLWTSLFRTPNIIKSTTNKRNERILHPPYVKALSNSFESNYHNDGIENEETKESLN